MMENGPAVDITILLNSWTSGAPGALDQLMATVYPELHRIAARHFRDEAPVHTLQCTALINEAYLRLAKSPAKQWNDRAHFFGFAARVMRGILVDHARARQALKRGGVLPTLTISDTDSAAPAQEAQILDVNNALDELEALDSTQGRVVELRFFGGLSIEETAEVLGVSTSTVKREWILAKTWIRRRLLTGKDAE
jgi:RNA polymerase sigma factor (TIGR02999 family)